MIARLPGLVTLVALAASACSDPPARVRLVPVDLGGCGQAAAAAVKAMRVIAYAGDGEHPQGITPGGRIVSLTKFPADTEQLALVVSGAMSDLARGKSAPLAFDSLADGTEIPIAVLPADGFCATAKAMNEARVDPLVAHAGDGVLLVGGTGATGQPLATAEYYDRATATFGEISVPVDLGPAGFTGAALTELANGDVLITGPGHVALVFDPTARAFVTGAGLPDSFAEERAFHAMRAIDVDHVIVAGGCRGVMSGTCDMPEANSFRYPLADLGTLGARDDGPVLGSATQDGAQLYDLGTQLDGTRAMVLAGGRSAGTFAERFDPGATRVGTEVSGFQAQVAQLPGGALLSAFAADGASPATGAAAVLAPGAPAAEPVAFATPHDGARLVTLEDGSVLAVGGDPTGQLARYLPTTDRWLPLTPIAAGSSAVTAADVPADLTRPALALLSDGSVLVAGGQVAGQPSTAAWLYRPSLIGAWSGLVEVDGDGGGEGGVLVPSDPAPPVTTHAGNTFVLTAGTAELTARALVGGVLSATGSVNAFVEKVGGGVALIAQQLGPGRALVGELVPGTRARIAHIDGPTATVSCAGQVVPAFAASPPTAIVLAVDGHSATLSLAGTPLVVCDLSSDPDAGDRGAWGIAADGPGATVQVDTIAVAR